MWTYAWVVLPEEPEDLHDGVREVMDDHYDEMCLQFYRIGGRYTGVIDSPDPRNEPLNYEDSCEGCRGTGVMTMSKGGEIRCLLCGGKGRELKDPENWVRPAKNVRSTQSLLMDLESVFIPFEVYTPDGCYKSVELDYYDHNPRSADLRAYEFFTKCRGKLPADVIIEACDSLIRDYEEPRPYEELWNEWMTELRNILGNYPDGVVVVISYHS